MTASAEERLHILTAGELQILQYEKEVNGDVGFSIIGGVDTCVERLRRALCAFLLSFLLLPTRHLCLRLFWNISPPQPRLFTQPPRISPPSPTPFPFPQTRLSQPVRRQLCQYCQAWHACRARRAAARRSSSVHRRVQPDGSDTRGSCGSPSVAGPSRGCCRHAHARGHVARAVSRGARH